MGLVNQKLKFGQAAKPTGYSLHHFFIKNPEINPKKYGNFIKLVTKVVILYKDRIIDLIDYRLFAPNLITDSLTTSKL